MNYTPTYVVGYMASNGRAGIMTTGDMPLAMAYALELRDRGDAPYMAIDGECGACKGCSVVYPSGRYRHGKRCQDCRGKASRILAREWAPCLPELAKKDSEA